MEVVAENSNSKLEIDFFRELSNGAMIFKIIDDEEYQYLKQQARKFHKAVKEEQ